MRKRVGRAITGGWLQLGVGASTGCYRKRSSAAPTERPVRASNCCSTKDISLNLMLFGPPSAVRRASFVIVFLCAVVSGACAGRGVFKPEYEYEEELYLALDGSATLNVNASVASLVALRGFTLDPNPRARLDRAAVRALFEGPGAAVSKVSLSRRDGRRFVHVSIDVDDVRKLATLAPFAWSAYRFGRQGDVMEFRQVVGPSAGKRVDA